MEKRYVYTIWIICLGIVIAILLMAGDIGSNARKAPMSESPKQLAKTAAEHAKSGQAANHKTLIQLLNSDKFLLDLNT